MQVVILAGGLGTRLDPTGKGIPKALRKVNGITILEWQLRNIENLTTRIIILVGESHNLEFFQEEKDKLISKYGFDITLISEKNRLGTMGAIKAIETKLDRKFVVLLGDILLDYPIEQSLSTLQKRIEFAAVVRVTDHPEDSDIYEIDGKGKILSFSHYPHKNNLSDRPHLGLTGVFSCTKKFLRRVPAEKFIDIWEMLEIDYLKKQYIGLIFSFNKFKDVGTTKRLELAREFVDTLNFETKSNVYFVDRDNTLIEDPNHNQKIELIYNSALISELNLIKNIEHDSEFFLITNQPSIAKGQKSENEVIHENQSVLRKLNLERTLLRSFEYCPHHPESGHKGEITELKMHCFCRKPLPGMAFKLLNDFKISPKKIVVYGDSFFDFALSKNLLGEFRWIHFVDTKTTSNFYKRLKSYFSLSIKIARHYGLLESLRFHLYNFTNKGHKKVGYS